MDGQSYQNTFGCYYTPLTVSNPARMYLISTVEGCVMSIKESPQVRNSSTILDDFFV